MKTVHARVTSWLITAVNVECKESTCAEVETINVHKMSTRNAWLVSVGHRVKTDFLVAATQIVPTVFATDSQLAVDSTFASYRCLPSYVLQFSASRAALEISRDRSELNSRDASDAYVL